VQHIAQHEYHIKLSTTSKLDIGSLRRGNLASNKTNLCCLGVIDENGYNIQPSTDRMPYLALYYANGPGIAGRTNLSGIDTGQ